MEISFVWFDIGYTLLYMQREITYQQALRELGVEVSIDALDRGFHLIDKHFMREHPGVFLKAREIYMPWYLGMLNHHLGLDIGSCEIDARWEAIKAGIVDYWLPYDGVHAVLGKLKDDGIGLGVISNWDLSARDLLGRCGLLDFFHPVVISEEVGWHKPSPKIFEHAITEAGVNASQCLYVGDNYYDDAIGSRRVGIQPIIINRFGRLGVEEIDDCPIILDLSGIRQYIGRGGG